MSQDWEVVHVLHVDDDPDFAELTAAALEREDDRLEVETVTDAAEGLSRIESGSYDCVVTDYDMPEMDGVELLAAVREEYPDLPVILFTGKGSEEVASEAIAAGVTDYLQKNPGTDQYTVLANRIHNAVEQSESRRALQRRNAELRRYKNMVDSMGEAACIYDSEGCFEIVNEYLADWYGTTPAALEGQESNLLPEIRSAADGDPFRELLEGRREEIDGEIDGEFPGHGYAVLEYRLTPLWADDEIEGVVGVARDITERKQTEEQLAAYIENASDILGIVNENAVFIDLSPAIERVTGYAPEELEGEHVFDYVHPEDSERIADEFLELVESSDDSTDRTKRVEYRFEHADGSWRWLESVGSDRSDSALGGYVITTRDITDRKQWERELQERTEALETLTSRLEEQYDYLFEEAPVMAVVTRAEEGRPIVEDCNRRFLDRLGYDEDEVVGRELAAFYTDDSARRLLGEEGYERALSGDFVREDRELVTADGEHVETLLRAVPRRDAREDVVGTLAMYVDVSERRELEREKARLEEFTSVVSHDLRNPLNVARGRAELAAEERDDEHLPVVLRSLERMEELIEDLLELARSGEDVTAVEPVSVEDVSRHAWQNVETAGATLRTDVDRRIRADRIRLQQLLENLFRNAVEHGSTSPRSGTPGDALEHGGESVTVTVATIDEGIAVEDTGSGIPAEDRERVFEAGFSGSNTGTGFGLSIVNQVCEAHGWEIGVTNGSSGGARFEITGIEFDE